MAEYRPPTPEKPLSPESSFENQVESPEYTEQQVERQSEQEQQSVEQQADAARRHMAELIEDQKQDPITATDDTDELVEEAPKREQSFTAWLEHIDPAERVPVSKKLILTKGKKLVDVIHAFLLIEDFTGLDHLEEELSESYGDLVSAGVVPDLRRK